MAPKSRAKATRKAQSKASVDVRSPARQTRTRTERSDTICRRLGLLADMTGPDTWAMLVIVPPKDAGPALLYRSHPDGHPLYPDKRNPYPLYPSFLKKIGKCEYRKPEDFASVNGNNTGRSEDQIDEDESDSEAEIELEHSPTNGVVGEAQFNVAPDPGPKAPNNGFVDIPMQDYLDVPLQAAAPPPPPPQRPLEQQPQNYWETHQQQSHRPQQPHHLPQPPKRPQQSHHLPQQSHLPQQPLLQQQSQQFHQQPQSQPQQQSFEQQPCQTQQQQNLPPQPSQHMQHASQQGYLQQPTQLQQHLQQPAYARQVTYSNSVPMTVGPDPVHVKTSLDVARHSALQAAAGGLRNGQYTHNSRTGRTSTNDIHKNGIMEALALLENSKQGYS